MPRWNGRHSGSVLDVKSPMGTILGAGRKEFFPNPHKMWLLLDLSIQHFRLERTSHGFRDRYIDGAIAFHNSVLTGYTTIFFQIAPAFWRNNSLQ